MAFDYYTWRPEAAPIDPQNICRTKIKFPEKINLLQLEKVRADWNLRIDQRPAIGMEMVALAQEVIIQIKFTHFIDPRTGFGFVSSERRAKLVKALNNAFKGSRIRFKNAKTQLVHNHQFCFDLENDFTEEAAKQNYHANPDHFLNIYTASLSSATWGWGTFPTEYMFPANNPTKWMDGVVVSHLVVPGGPDPRYAQGKRVVHEVGHWLGLFHTFHQGCSGNGDDIKDTPAHSAANLGVPPDGLPNGACNIGELAPIHNYMNYTDDVCMTQFTPEQIEKMRKVMQLLRPNL